MKQYGDEKYKVYESMSEAAKAVGGHPTNIGRSCKKADKLYKGFYWRKEVK